MTIYFSQLLYQILLGYTMPYETPSKNILALTNEILCSLYLMMYLMASEFNDNSDIRSAAGTGLLLIISFYVALNFLYFLVSLISQLRRPMRRIGTRVKKFLANKRGRGVVAMKPLKQHEESTMAI
jgi:glycerol uptake facilitator-like aquaporin